MAGTREVMSGARAHPDRSRFRRTIAAKITSRMLTIAAIPVLAVGLLTTGSLFALANRTDDQLRTVQADAARHSVGEIRAEQTRLFLIRLDRFVDERFDDLVDWSRDDIVVSATLADYEATQAMVDWPAELIEARLDSGDQLDTGGASPGFLAARVDDETTYTEVLVTDRNGFTIGATNPSTDFLHRDRQWWRSAWAEGAYVGPLVTDEATGRLSFDLAVRVHEPNNNRGSGVIRAVLDAAILQPLADDFANSDEQINLWLLTEDGRLVLETATGHDPERIGSALTLAPAVDELFRRALTDDEQRSGPIVSERSVSGYGWTSSSRTIARLGADISSPRLFALTEQPSSAALAALGPFDELGTGLGTAPVTMALIVAGLIGATLLIAYWASRVLANQITEPLRVLGAEARRLADSELPALVHTLQSTDGSGEIPRVDLIDIEAEGEVAELADAFNSLRATTVELAATQAIGHSKDLAGVLVNLGRRNQHLIGRQLQFIDELEATESDPDTLQNLFGLDQMATRMRRNAESLLVLAGERVPRQASRPQPIEDVLRAATSEVEDYARVSLSAIEPALVAPRAVGDLTHLLAELIENATGFSPPETVVEVIGRWDDRGYTVAVVDQGHGMSPIKLAEANARFSQTNFSDETPTSYLGLFVVGRLAARHNIDARLIESAAAGTTAKVRIPARCVTAIPEPDGDVTGSTLRAPDPLSCSGDGRWPPLSRRASLPVPAPEIGYRSDRVDAPSPIPTMQQPAAANGHLDHDGPTPTDSEAEPDETAGVPIPPFRARRSRRPAADDHPVTDDRCQSADEHVHEQVRTVHSHPSSPTFRTDERTTGGGHLEIVPAAAAPDAESRAIEVRERLSRFTMGVAAAKAAATASVAEDRTS